jgi:hypothetical protein
MTQRLVYKFPNVTVIWEGNGAMITYEDQRPTPANQDEFQARAHEYQQLILQIQSGQVTPTTMVTENAS